MQQVKAVIVREKDAPAELTTITVPDPGPGEALVKVLTCGVCQTDMHYQKGGVGTTSPTCWATRPPGSSRPWARTSPASPSATT